MKILGIILESGELNITEIARRSGLSHSSAARHLEFLVGSGLITEKRFNRIRIFRVDHSNPFIETLNRFVSDWNSLSAAGSVRKSFS
ncbi:MAG: winged helix-turn-helix domain-containing protein [Thaumarchaeota archaeon]|nr:winged helix-turn-helix domain-containing protein [Nitrososphaerota archaeon]